MGAGVSTLLLGVVLGMQGWSQLRLCQCWVMQGAPHSVRSVPKLAPIPSALHCLAALSSFAGLGSAVRLPGGNAVE